MAMLTMAMLALTWWFRYTYQVLTLPMGVVAGTSALHQLATQRTGACY